MNTNSRKNNPDSPDSIYSLISKAVPICDPDATLEDITDSLMETSWEVMDYVFVLNKKKELLGMIDLAKLSHSDKSVKVRNLMVPCKVTLTPESKRQRAVVLALRNDVDIMPVVDKANVFLGAIISKTIIDMMHEEHLESAMITSGVSIKKHQPLAVATAGLFEVISYRLPWLVIGLLAGLGLGLISSKFESHLKENIAIAYFIPVVAYIADSVGTQSEAIAVRSLAILKVNHFLYLFREMFIGTSMGLIIGVLGGLGAAVISGQSQIGVVVGMSLFVASAIAAVVASAIPILFKVFGKDPALGSGPLATALQDVISVIIYFIFVSMML